MIDEHHLFRDYFYIRGMNSFLINICDHRSKVKEYKIFFI